MSDSEIETEISEEEFPSGWDDGSAYDPTGYSNEDSFRVESIKVQPPAPSQLPTKFVAATKAVPGPTYSTKPTLTNFNRKGNDISAISVDYSAVFDDDFEKESDGKGSSNYSNDFEEDFEQDFEDDFETSVLPNHPPNPIPSHTQPPSSGPVQPLLALPSLNIQAAQAELAIDEISKEVLRLRNRQKALLRERREVAKEKKLRAEQRRHQYQAEMKILMDRASSAEAERDVLRDEVASVRSEVEAMAQSRVLLQAALDSSNRTNDALREQVAAAEADRAIKQGEAEAAHARAVASAERVSSEMKQLRTQLQRAELMLSVLQKSTEANEERLIRERDRLPAYHQQVLDEQMQRLTALEGALQEREGVLRVEEARRLQSVDQLRAETLSELERTRVRMDFDNATAREDLACKLQIFEREKREFHSEKALELAAIESKKMEVVRLQKSSDEERQHLQRDRAELEARVRMQEPHLSAAERDREDARALKQRAELELTRVEDKCSAVLAADRQLLQRERALMDGLETLQRAKAELLEEAKAVEEKLGWVTDQQELAEQERFQLHVAAVEMGEQVAEIKSALQVVLRKGGSSQPFAVGKENSSLVVDSSTRVRGSNGRGSDDADRNIYTLTDKASSPSAHLDPSVGHAFRALEIVADALRETAASFQTQRRAQPLPAPPPPPPPSSRHRTSRSSPPQPSTPYASPYYGLSPEPRPSRSEKPPLSVSSEVLKPTRVVEESQLVLDIQCSLDETDSLTAALKRASDKYSTR